MADACPDSTMDADELKSMETLEGFSMSENYHEHPKLQSLMTSGKHVGVRFMTKPV